MPTRWVDYKRLRESLDIGQVLKDYGVELKAKGDQLQGFCPLPRHQGRKRSPSFSVNTQRGIFQCFGCGAKGNVIEFVALMERLDPQDSAQFRKAALRLQERYFEVANDPDCRDEPGDEKVSDTEIHDDRPHLVNVPMDFTLTGLDPDHPYLRQRNLKPETIALFGLGYCNRGLMKGRIAIPLHDQESRLIGYAGRLTDDNKIGEGQPRYKFPGTRERDGTVCDFSKSMFLFNGHRIAAPIDNLIVVEGFFGAFWLHQCGYKNVVALMGSSCNVRQAELLRNLLQPVGCLWLMPDGDEAGRRCAAEIMLQVAPHRAVRWVQLDPEKQPDDCSSETLSNQLWSLV